MSFNFPASPVVGQTSEQNGRVYQWSGAAWRLVPSGGGGSSQDAGLRSYFLPPQPTNLLVTAGDGQVALSWTAPTVISQIPITDYTIQYSQGYSGIWSTFSHAASTSTSATVTGLTNGTAYLFRVAAVNGLGAGNAITYAFPVTPVGGDAYFNKVSLLLHADGTGSTFVDSSPYARAISASGNATQSSAQSMFGGKSLALDGAGDFLTTPIAPSLEFGTGDFTVEAMIRLTTVKNCRIVGIGAGANGGPYAAYTGWSMRLEAGQFGFYRYDGTTETNLSYGFTWATNVWYHVAVSRSSNTINVYVDGVRIGTASNTTNFNRINDEDLFVGRMQVGSSNSDFDGFIDEVRVTKGVGRYTGSTITVPTAAFPDTDTNGIVPDPYFSNTALLLHMDGNGNTFVDSSGTPKTVTASGNATQSATQSKFGGKAAYIANGNTDGIAIANSSALIPSGDFTLEGWVYFTDLSTIRVVAQTTWNGTGGALAVWHHTAYQGKLSIWADSYNANNAMLVSNSVVTTNTWTHFAVSRSGNTFFLYLNGTRETQFTQSVSISRALRSLGVYADGSGTLSGYPLNGYLDDIRFTVGSARYTGSTITVPTAAFPDS